MELFCLNPPVARRPGLRLPLFRSCAVLSVVYRILLVSIAVPAFIGSVAQAREIRRLGISRLNEDQLGESLNKFRSLHKEANCLVRPMEWLDERHFKTDWVLWVDCGLEKGVRFEGQELLAEGNPHRPFGVLASFYKRKLIELSYTLSATSIEALLPILQRGYGEPDHITRDAAGFLDSLTWADHATSLDVELVPISLAVVDGNFLRVGKGLLATFRRKYKAS